MSDIKGPRSPPARKPAANAPPRPTAASGRLDRPTTTRAPSRHGAITRTLNNYANYKRWAEKMTVSWEPGKDPKA